MERSDARVAAAQAALALTTHQLADCRIAAPFSGTVLERFVEVGDVVTPDAVPGSGIRTHLLTIADTARLRVDVDVAEQDIRRIRRGMQCTIVPDAYPDRRYTGHVLRIDPQGNYSKGTVGVKVRIERPDAFARIGGGARVEFLD